MAIQVSKKFYFNQNDATVGTTIKAMVGVYDKAVNLNNNESYQAQLRTRPLKAFALIGFGVGVVAAIVTVVALLAIFCPPALAALAVLAGVTLPTLGLSTVVGCAAGAAVLTLLGFVMGGRAAHLLRQPDAAEL